MTPVVHDSRSLVPIGMNVARVPTFQQYLDIRGSKYFVGGPYISVKKVPGGPYISAST